jgi:hypothetical protein
MDQQVLHGFYVLREESHVRRLLSHNGYETLLACGGSSLANAAPLFVSRSRGSFRRLTSGATLLRGLGKGSDAARGARAS